MRLWLVLLLAFLASECTIADVGAIASSAANIPSSAGNSGAMDKASKAMNSAKNGIVDGSLNVMRVTKNAVSVECSIIWDFSVNFCKFPIVL
jgi:hypothetical protein